MAAAVVAGTCSPLVCHAIVCKGHVALHRIQTAKSASALALIWTASNKFSEELQRSFRCFGKQWCTVAYLIADVLEQYVIRHWKVPDVILVRGQADCICQHCMRVLYYCSAPRDDYFALHAPSGGWHACVPTFTTLHGKCSREDAQVIGMRRILSHITWIYVLDQRAERWLLCCALDPRLGR